MTNDFNEVMARKSDEDLIKILVSPEDNYQPAALEAAKNEFEKRNLSDERLLNIKAEIQMKDEFEQEKAAEPLPVGIRILSFLFPGIIPLLFAGVYKADGYDTKASEVVRWTLYGFGFYLLMIFLVTFFG